MYSRKAWGGPVDPYINILFPAVQTDKDAVVSVVVFEWKDEDLIGIRENPESLKVSLSSGIYMFVVFGMI